jgi:hypothetical protein
MNKVVRNIAFGTLLVFPLLAAAKADEAFKLSNSENISCSRDLRRGKLRISTCSSYAYLFNVRTSEYFRCNVSLVVTRQGKAREVIDVQSDGHCARKPRIFESDSSYEMDAAETEPPNANAFFGRGGASIWAADTTRQKVRGCITIATAQGSDVSRCIDMQFN